MYCVVNINPDCKISFLNTHQLFPISTNVTEQQRRTSSPLVPNHETFPSKWHSELNSEWIPCIKLIQGIPIILCCWIVFKVNSRQLYTYNLRPFFISLPYLNNLGLQMNFLNTLNITLKRRKVYFYNSKSILPNTWLFVVNVHMCGFWNNNYFQRQFLCVLLAGQIKNLLSPLVLKRE